MTRKTSATGKTKVKRGRGNPNIREVGKATQFKPDNKETGEIDPRINRAGTLKPRSTRMLEELLDREFDRELTVKESGELMTALQAMIRDMIHNKQAAGRIELLARRFGKVPQAVDVNLTWREKAAQQGINIDDIERAARKAIEELSARSSDGSGSRDAGE